MQITEVIYNNMDLIKHQIDFIQEVKNIQIFQKFCKHLKYIKIPNVDQAITEKYNNIILMDYIKYINHLKKNNRFRKNCIM